VSNNRVKYFWENNISLMKMKSKLATRSLLILALTSVLVLQVIRPVHAVTTTGYITVYIVNTKSGRANLVGTTGVGATFTITESGGHAVINYWIPALKGNLYKFFYRNYGPVVECLVDDANTVESFSFPALHGPKQLEVFIEVNSLAGYDDLHFNVYIIPPG
jgi:hypothetical protein